VEAWSSNPNLKKYPNTESYQKIGEKWNIDKGKKKNYFFLVLVFVLSFMFGRLVL
jgi:hypothetical protein